MKAIQLPPPAMRPAWQIPIALRMEEDLSIDFPQYFTQPAIVPGSAGSGAFGNGIPWFISVGQQHTDGASNYNSFQASLTKGTSHGLYFTLAYTYSHALDNASGYESSGANGRGVNNIPGFEYLNYGDSDYDARHRLATSYNYEVPIFSSWQDKLVLREALSGWHISGVTALQTGFPVTIQDKGTPNSLYCNAGQFLSFYNCPDTPDASSFNIKTFNPRISNHEWFDPTLFTQEPIGSLGNVKRNFFHGPGFNYTNLSLYKDFPLGAEKARYVEIRVEAFNAFNHANFGQPDGNYTDGPGILWRGDLCHRLDDSRPQRRSTTGPGRTAGGQVLLLRIATGRRQRLSISFEPTFRGE